MKLFLFLLVLLASSCVTVQEKADITVLVKTEQGVNVVCNIKADIDEDTVASAGCSGSVEYKGVVYDCSLLSVEYIRSNRKIDLDQACMITREIKSVHLALRIFNEYKKRRNTPLPPRSYP